MKELIRRSKDEQRFSNLHKIALTNCGAISENVP